MKILITGGAGYIGSHTAVTLLNAGYDVVIADNLINSQKENIKAIENITQKRVVFYGIDLCNYEGVKKIFDNEKIEGIIHFAGLKALGESVVWPLKYYSNNLETTFNLLKLCHEYDVNQFVFSSSATVYGDNTVPFVETLPLMPTTNPYGETKRMIERILTDLSKANPNFSVTILRYFNPIGAHTSGLIGEVPNGIPNNLMPYITQVAKGLREHLYVFGNDYDTVDGTGVRDYIHVMDIASGHLKALECIKRGIDIFNLGTGKGTSVLELVTAFEKANNIKIPYIISPRREGDIAKCYANVDKAKKKLNWEAQRSILEMCRDSWNFEKNRITK